MHMPKVLLLPSIATRRNERGTNLSKFNRWWDALDRAISGEQTRRSIAIILPLAMPAHSC